MIYPEKSKQFVLLHESDDVSHLALHASAYPDIDIPFVLQQIAGRQIAKRKIPSWYLIEDILYPKHISLEQCSSEDTAIYKSRLLEKCTLLDMTGGMGIDFYFMSLGMDNAEYVESQRELTDLARHNFNVLGFSNFEVIEADGTDYLKASHKIYDTIYIDPARRNESGKKTVFIEDCSPNLIKIDDLLDAKSVRTIIKLSPMLDISHALHSLKNITQVHIISVANECKELVLVKEKTEKETQIHCVNILNNEQNETFIFTYQQEGDAVANHTDSVGFYLYEPNSSILKAGGYKSIASVFGLKKLHPNSHLYTSDHYVEDFPGRKFSVCKVIAPNKKELKLNLKDIHKANISTRNYPFSVAEIRKQTGLKEGGAQYIFATTLANEKKVLILCEKATI